MKARRLSETLICFSLLPLIGCDKALDETSIKSTTKNYDVAIESGVRGQFYPRDFNRLFPGAMNIISYYTGEVGPSKWVSKASLYGKYVLMMVASIEFDRARTNILSMGQPDFSLVELSKITPNKDPTRQPSVQTGTLARFSADSWHRLVETKGDFSALGIALETNRPVEGFTFLSFLRGLRELSPASPWFRPSSRWRALGLVPETHFVVPGRWFWTKASESIESRFIGMTTMAGWTECMKVAYREGIVAYFKERGREAEIPVFLDPDTGKRMEPFVTRFPFPQAELRLAKSYDLFPREEFKLDNGWITHGLPRINWRNITDNLLYFFDADSLALRWKIVLPKGTDEVRILKDMLLYTRREGFQTCLYGRVVGAPKPKWKFTIPKDVQPIEFYDGRKRLRSLLRQRRSPFGRR